MDERLHSVKQRINLTWVLKLRWGAVMGQAVAAWVAQTILGLYIPAIPIAIIFAITVGSNIGLTLWLKRGTGVREAVVGIVIALDILLLSGLLYLSGGPANPFTCLYLVHIALAAVVLSPSWTWSLVALAFCAFIGLFYGHIPLSWPLDRIADAERLRQQGTAIAFVLAAGFISYFVHRINSHLSQTEDQLRVASDVATRTERLTSLATLAAGAAHELSTPLATIAVAAKELERQLKETNARDDARLIREQVERCRKVLTQMATDAGQSAGEPFVRLTPAELIEHALAEIRPRDRVKVEIDGIPSILWIPERTVAQGIRAVIKNGLDASSESAELRVSLHSSHDVCRITITDHGRGMDAEVMARAGEPFFTTKGPGQGMGLGLFLTRTVLERLGGGMQLESVVGHGTTVMMTLPLASFLHE